MGGAGFDIAVIGIGVIAAACFVGLVFLGVYCWTLYIAMKAAASVPSAHRRFEPGLVWLMLIPLFNAVWAFFMTRGITRGMQQAFASRGLERGDCGAGAGLAYAILTAISTVLSLMTSIVQAATGQEGGPGAIASCGGSLVGIGSLVYWIVFLVRVNRLGKELRLEFEHDRASVPSQPPTDPLD